MKTILLNIFILFLMVGVSIAQKLELTINKKEYSFDASQLTIEKEKGFTVVKAMEDGRTLISLFFPVTEVGEYTKFGYAPYRMTEEDITEKRFTAFLNQDSRHLLEAEYVNSMADAADKKALAEHFPQYDKAYFSISSNNGETFSGSFEGLATAVEASQLYIPDEIRYLKGVFTDIKL